PEVDVVRDSSYLSFHDPFVPTMADTALMPCDGESFDLDHCIGFPTPFAPFITVCRSLKHAQQVRISSAFLTRSHVGGKELWSTGGFCSYAAFKHLQVPRVKRLKTKHVQGALPGICTTPSPTNIWAGCAQKQLVFGSDWHKTGVLQPFPRAEERLSYAEHMSAISSDDQASWPWAPHMLELHL